MKQPHAYICKYRITKVTLFKHATCNQWQYIVWSSQPRPRYARSSLLPRGGTCQNFDRNARPIFLSLKFGQILFFWVGKYFSYFSGFCKISCYFLSLTNFQLFFWVFQFCPTHMNPLHKENTVLKNIKS